MDIHFENLSTITTTHTAKALTQPRLASSTSIEDYSVSTTTSGDSISFTFDVVNEGNYNAKITSVSIGTPECTGTDSVSNSNVCGHLTYTLTYDNGASVQINDLVYAKETVTMKVTLTYDDTVTSSELATEDVSISNLGITINFEQTGDALVKENGEVADYRVYHVGDKITLNDEDYWVIENSEVNKDYIVALKDIPLTANEVNLYGIDSNGINHINNSGTTSTSGRVAYDFNDNCDLNKGLSGCNKYDNAQIKYVVDSWAESTFNNQELKELDGYFARLLKLTEANNNLLCNKSNCKDSPYNWARSYTSWTFYDQMSDVYAYFVHGGTHHGYSYKCQDCYYVRPVINVYKSALLTNNTE